MRDFRDYMVRGGAVDLAVAIVLGIAVAEAIRSLVGNVVTPLVGAFGEVDFADLAVSVGSSQVRYGLFINDVLTLVLVAATVYLAVVRPLQRVRSTTVAPDTRPCDACLSSIPAAATRCAFCTAEQPPADIEIPDVSPSTDVNRSV